MQTSEGLDLIWWITAVELPALAGLFWIGWRNYRAAHDHINEVRHSAEVGLAHLRQNLDAYKLDVAKHYASISYLRDVEERLTDHLIRIEDKLDIVRTDRVGGWQMSTNTLSLESQRNREVDILARTIYGEARGETVRGKEAVACVIMNRVYRAKNRGGYWWGATIEQVCHKPWQFSCWNEDDPNLEKIETVQPGHRVFDTCVRIARRAISGSIEDMTDGATHYHTKAVNPPWSKGHPACVELGRHLFYNNIE